MCLNPGKYVTLLLDPEGSNLRQSIRGTGCTVTIPSADKHWFL